MTSSARPDLELLLASAQRWLAEDPDKATRAELERVIAAAESGGDPADLADRFDGTLEFGTAGLRGALGAGPNRMNRVVVIAGGGRAGGVPLDQGAPVAAARSSSATTPGTTPTCSPATPPR